MRFASGPVFLGLLFPALAVWGQTTYTDPNGRFSIDVPAGWQTSADAASGQVTLSNGPVSASLGIGSTDNGSTPKPEDVLTAVRKQAEPACPRAQVNQRGQATLAGIPGAFLVLSCQDPRGQTILKFSVATMRGRIIVFNTTGPVAQYSRAASVLDAMARSLRLAIGASEKGGPFSSPATNANTKQLSALDKGCAAGVFTPEECASKRAALTRSAAGQQPAPSEQAGVTGSQPASNVYRDPQDRFEVSIPPGWRADPQGENGSQGVKLSAGSSWAFIGPFGGATNASNVVVKLATQFQSQYKNFSMLKHAPVTVNGHAAEYAVFTGANPQGSQVALMIAGIAATDGHYLAMMSSCPFQQAT